ncbi:MAG: hypothetical protein RQ862_10765 [Candidatus Caldarchaeales archaeon]|jgi:hypothetical protein|nr:hypothetical protein [Candidatus Caldarchaeales archaeon]
MRWAWSEAVVSAFKKKYASVLESLGWKYEISERVVRQMGGLERLVSIAIFRDGRVAVRHVIIQEVVARDSHWVRVASTYNSTGVVRTNLDEQIWKGFYSQLNKIVAHCVLDLIHEIGNLQVGGSTKFSLQEGLELEIGYTKVKIPVSQIAETPKIIALLAL